MLTESRNEAWHAHHLLAYSNTGNTKLCKYMHKAVHILRLYRYNTSTDSKIKEKGKGERKKKKS